MVAWKPVRYGVEFILFGKSEGYVAMGISDRMSMSGIKATVCAYDGRVVSLYNAYNSGYYQSAALEVSKRHFSERHQ